MIGWELAAVYLVAGMHVAMGALDQPRARRLYALTRASAGPGLAALSWTAAFVLTSILWPYRLPSVWRALRWPPPEGPDRPRPRPPWGQS